MLPDLRVEPLLKPGAECGAALRGQSVERPGGADRGLEQRPANGEAGEDMTLPGYREAAIVLGDQLEHLVGSLDQRGCTAVELLAEAPLGGRQEEPFIGE